MTRIKKGKIKSLRHKKILKSVKGNRGAKGRLFKSAKEASLHAGNYAFSGRRQRKRQKRSLWIVKINAVIKNKGITYNKFINDLKKADIHLDRKILAEIAVSDNNTFDKILSEIK